MGGHVAHVIGVLQGLKDLGHEVTVLSEESISLVDEIADRVILVPCDTSGKLGRFLWNFKFVKTLSGLEQNVDFAYMRYSVGFSPFIAGLKKKLGKCPLMIEVNSFLSQRKPIVRFLEGRFMAAADYVLTVSERNRDEMLRFFGSDRLKQLIVVTNGVDLSRFSDWESSVSREWHSPVVFGYAGIIKDWYGLDAMIEGFKLLRSRVPSVSFKMIGDGPYRAVLEEKYREVEGLEFVGPKPFEKMPELLAGVDVLVNSATSQNAFQSPTKMFEYMASGRPILSARTPQCEALLKGGEFGSLYEIDDVESFAVAAQSILADQAAALAKARAARLEAESSHSWIAKCQLITGTISEGTK